MQCYKKWITAFIAVTMMGILVGCGTNGVNSSSTPNVSNNTASGSAPVIRSTTTKSTSKRSHSGSTQSTIKWNPTIIQAMQYVVKRTQVSLQAPTDIPRYGGGFYLSAQAQATNSSYNITLQYTTTKLPVNSLKINQLPNGAFASWVGGFGAKEYPTATDARKSLPHYSDNVATSANSEKVSLGHGIFGEVLKQDGMGIVEWEEGDWSLQVNNGTVNADISVAKQIVVYLNHYLLPETYGSLIVGNAGDGEHTTLEWADGNTVYNCSNFHSALAAIQSAISMKLFDVR